MVDYKEYLKERLRGKSHTLRQLQEATVDFLDAQKRKRQELIKRVEAILKI